MLRFVTTQIVGTSITIENRCITKYPSFGGFLLDQTPAQYELAALAHSRRLDSTLHIIKFGYSGNSEADSLSLY